MGVWAPMLPEWTGGGEERDARPEEDNEKQQLWKKIPQSSEVRGIDVILRIRKDRGRDDEVLCSGRSAVWQQSEGGLSLWWHVLLASFVRSLAVQSFV